jgi:hypothetical protein
MRQDSGASGIRGRWRFKAEYFDAGDLPERNGKPPIRQYDGREAGFYATYAPDGFGWALFPCRFATLADAERAANVLRKKIVEAVATTHRDVVLMGESSDGGVQGFVDQIVAESCHW